MRMGSGSFLRSGRGMLIADLVISFCILCLISIFREHADLVLTGSWFFAIAYLIFSHRILAVVHLLIATLFATVWLNYAKDYYGYKFVYHTIFGMNLLPLMAWAMSLFGVTEVYNYLTERIKKTFRFLLFLLIAWTILITFESVAYHLLKIRNTPTGNFAGLPFCDCLHAPTWMKVVYFSLGPAYYLTIFFVDIRLNKRFPSSKSW